MGTNKGNGFWDAYDGAQYVVRHCVLDGQGTAGNHGYDSSDWSPRTFEIYNNVITNGKAATPAFEIRGGTGYFASNTLSGWGTMATLCVFRASLVDHTSTGHGQLDGSTTNVLDGNIDGTGYPEHQQVGTIKSMNVAQFWNTVGAIEPVAPFNATNMQVLYPVFSWSNTLSGTLANPVVQGPYAEGLPTTNFIALNRDYFTDTIATNVTFLEYPHPLQASEGDISPDPETDDEAPTVAVTSPSSTNGWHITLTGTASDNVGVDHVTVKVNGVEIGTATGTTNWSIPADLREGANTILATAFDAASNSTSTTNVPIAFVPNQRVRLKGIRAAGGQLRSN